ncbi:MAG: hypothetical protein PHZ09_13650, partial [Eubacteriales bacterium]|nr:hypothetical protein [Eubacteriales bacterium]
LMGFSCADADNTVSELTAAQTEAETENLELLLWEDQLPPTDYDGYIFRITTREVGYFNYRMDFDEVSGDLIGDAVYNRNRTVENRFNILFEEVYSTDPAYSRSSIIAGDDAYDMVKTRGPMAMTYWQEGLIYIFDQLPYINLDKLYWNRLLNNSLTVGGVQYIAAGAIGLVEYDYTSAILFNKNLISKYNLGDLYDAVSGGRWTFDTMNEYMTAVTADINGDGKMDEKDQYGLLCTYKEVLPGLIIGGGERMIGKDEDDMLYIAMTGDRFFSVFDKAFSITRDNNNWFVDPSGENISPVAVTMYKADQALFFDVCLYFAAQFRNMDTDFGIIPHPKFNEEQERYYPKCGWVEPVLAPITVADPGRTGMIIEALCCESQKTVIPAYYDVTLKTKITRDEQSEEMLDLIFTDRVLDYGDTVYHNIVRDGTMMQMFLKDDRNIASKIAGYERMLNAELSKINKILEQN